MFRLILISACTVMSVYVFWRASTVPALTERIPSSGIWLLGFGLWLLLVLGRVYGHHNHGPLAVGLELAGMTWLAALFLLFLCLIFVDLVTVFGFAAPHLGSKLRGLALAAGLTMTAIGLFQGTRTPVVVNYEVEMERLPPELDGTTLVVMSDLHLGSQRGKEWLEARVDQVNALKPDLVLLVGDVFEGHGPPREELKGVFRGMKARIGSYAVLGNHEFYGGSSKGQRDLEESGFKVLRNGWAQTRPGLIISGVDDLTVRRRQGREDEDYISRALDHRPEGATILLSHTPLDADIAEAGGVGLMLSGHTHDGQIWPFGYLIGRIYPFVGGLYNLGKMTIIVCRGTGLWGPPVRLWHPSEIVHIVLKAKNK